MSTRGTVVVFHARVAELTPEHGMSGAVALAMWELDNEQREATMALADANRAAYSACRRAACSLVRAA